MLGQKSAYARFKTNSAIKKGSQCMPKDAVSVLHWDFLRLR